MSSCGFCASRTARSLVAVVTVSDIARCASASGNVRALRRPTRAETSLNVIMMKMQAGVHHAV